MLFGLKVFPYTLGSDENVLKPVLPGLLLPTPLISTSFHFLGWRSDRKELVSTEGEISFL